MYYRYREYYNVSNGHLLARDSIIKFDSTSSYVYVKNNPVIWNDTCGLFPPDYQIDPRVHKNAGAYICCLNNKINTCWVNKQPEKIGFDCLFVHEKDHKKIYIYDIKCHCKNKNDGTAFIAPERTTANEMEYRAYLAQYCCYIKHVLAQEKKKILRKMQEIKRLVTEKGYGSKTKAWQCK